MLGRGFYRQSPLQQKIELQVTNGLGFEAERREGSDEFYLREHLMSMECTVKREWENPEERLPYEEYDFAQK